VAGTMEHSARALFQSLRRMREFPEYLQLWPGHGAGSACGKSLGSMPSTTLGYERLFNWAFQVSDEEEFVRAVLAGQPEPPRYFGRMKLLNRDGPPPWPTTKPRLFDATALAGVLDDHAGTVVVDTRSSSLFAAGFIPGTIHIPAGRSFTTWAGSLLDPDRDIVLIADGDARASALARELFFIGLDRLVGWADAKVIDAWRAAGRRLESVQVVDARALSELEGIEVIDVRADSEWNAGRIPGARHIFLGNLPEASEDLPRDRTLVVTCQGGTRSSIGASLLRARGFANVINFTGGFSEWQKAGLPVETSDASTASR
jgi:hydroxyacylglutathione hydrolase